MSRKVLFLTDGLGSGGAERQLFLTASGMPDEWTVAVWTLHDGYFRNQLEEAGTEVFYCAGNASLLRAYRSLSSCLRDFRPDVVHCWGSASLILSYPLLRGKVPVVNGTVRRSFVPRGIAGRLRQFLACRLGDVVVSNSRAAVETLKLAARPFRVIHNGFSWDRLITDQTVGMDPAAFNVVMCANVKPGKDYALLVEAARILHSEHGREMPFRFWCIGAIADGDYYRRVVESAGPLIDGGFMIFTGAVDSPAPYLASADAGVLLSNEGFHAEGISNSIMEYMAAGLPVVCSDSGGNRELVKDGITGYILRTGTARETTDRLKQLRDSEITGREMGAKGRERIRKEFSLERMVDDTIGVYRELLG